MAEKDFLERSNPIWGIALAVFVFIALSLLFGSFYVVGAGERAVVSTFGNPNMVPYSEGLHFKIPIAQGVVKMDIKTLKYESDLTAASKDLQDVQTKIAINYRLEPNRVPEIYKTLGVGYASVYLFPLEQEANKATTAQFTAEELITKRNEVREKMLTLLREKLSGRGIIVEDVSIIDFKFSPSFTAAIENKVTAEQNSLAAKNKLEQIKYEAQQKVAAAEGDAQALTVQGNALRANPEVLQLRFIDKWDGKLSLVSGSAMPLVTVDSITGPVIPKA